MLEISSWFAVGTRARQEKLISEILYNKGYELFLPLYKSRRFWSDRIKEVELPLFPGYLFCRLTPKQRTLPLLMTPGVRGIVGFGNEPTPIPDFEIEAVQAIVKSKLLALPHPFLRVGQQVRVTYGPLEGLRGILISSKKNCRFIVSVEMLQRSVAVEVDGAWIEPVNGRAHGASPYSGSALGDNV
jgi:transcription antitermination factor NusG